MRAIVAVFFFTWVSFNVFAVEPIDEQQIMFYYHIPIGADKQHSKHEFGLRFDQTTHDPREVTQIHNLETRPAAMDFRMGYDGIQSINIRGVDYAKYLIAKAAEGEDAPVEVPQGEAAADAPADETTAEPEAATTEATTETTAEATEAPAEDVGAVSQAIKDVPVGVGIGLIIGLLLLAGAGG